jgi:hypothetical protein
MANSNDFDLDVQVNTSSVTERDVFGFSMWSQCSCIWCAF